MIYYTEELSHHGVKGMKWGVRNNKNDYSRYYNSKGKLNRKGRKVRAQAQQTRDFANAGKFRRTLGHYSDAAITARRYAGAKKTADMLHVVGNVRLNTTYKNDDYRKRQAVAGSYIAAMKAVKVAAIMPTARGYYRDYKYRNNSDYANKIDNLAKLKDRDKKYKRN